MRKSCYASPHLIYPIYTNPNPNPMYKPYTYIHIYINPIHIYIYIYIYTIYPYILHLSSIIYYLDCDSVDLINIATFCDVVCGDS